MLAALAVQATLTLGPAALTYPELADALSKAGMATIASSGLRSRAAYVSLHGRSPVSVRHLLGEALGVAFEPQRGGGWLMVADPAVKDRDHRFLLAYRRVAERAIRETQREVAERVSGRTYPAFLEDVKSRMEEAETRHLTEQDTRDLRARMWIAQPNLWTGLQVPVGELLDSINAPIKRRFPFRDLTMPSEVYNPLRREDDRFVPDPTPISSETPVEQSVRFDPRTATFIIDTPVVRPHIFGLQGSVSLSLKSGRLAAGVGPAPALEISAEPGDVAETFHAMGSEAERYLASLPPAELPDSPKIRGALPSSLSEKIEQLGGTDVAMELSPRFESFFWQGQPLRSDPDSFRTLFAPLSRSSGILFGPRGWLERTADAITALQSEDGERNWPWRAVNYEGVLLVINPYAFLDRAQPLPAAPFLRASRILSKGTNIPMGMALTYDQATQLVAAVRPELELREIDTVYRGLGSRFLQSLQIVVEGIGSLSRSDRDLLWQALRRDSEASVSYGGGSIDVQKTPMGEGVFLIALSFKDAMGQVTASGQSLLDGRGTLSP